MAHPTSKDVHQTVISIFILLNWFESRYIADAHRSCLIRTDAKLMNEFRDTLREHRSSLDVCPYGLSAQGFHGFGEGGDLGLQPVADFD